jgi:hypothetical protein
MITKITVVTMVAKANIVTMETGVSKTNLVANVTKVTVVSMVTKVNAVTMETGETKGWPCRIGHVCPHAGVANSVTMISKTTVGAKVTKASMVTEVTMVTKITMVTFCGKLVKV